MRVHIEAELPGPLAILSDLPDASLAILEGLNGIGKTLTIRLLQLCTGTLPYPKGDPSWKSLQEGLGTFEVTVSDLRDASRIEWRANSRAWLDADVTDFPTFERVAIDGHEASIEDVRRLLVVHRIAGDEGLVETFAQQAEVAAETIRRWGRLHTAEHNTPLAALEAILGDAIHALGDWTPGRFDDVQRAASDARTAHRDAEVAQRRALEERDGVLRLREAQRALEQTQTMLPDLAERVVAVDRAIEQLNRERESLQREITIVAGRVGAAAPVLTELRNARRTLQRNQERLADSLAIAATIAAELRIAPTGEAVNELMAGLERRRRELREEQLALDTAPIMRQLLADLTTELGGAEERGLGQQIAIDDPETDTQLTVTETRAGMALRRTYLEGQPPPPEARRVSDEMAQVERLLKRGEAITAALSEAERRRRLVSENEERVDRAVAATDPSTVAELQNLERQHREKDAALLALATDRAAVRQQLGALGGGETPEELEHRLRDGADALGIQLDRLDEAIGAADRTAAEAQTSLGSATAERDATTRELARATADIRRAVENVRSANDLEWLRRALPAGAVPAGELSVDGGVAVLEAVREQVSATTERLGLHRTQIAAIESALSGVARHLRGQPPGALEYVSQLQAWLGHRFSDWFNSEGVRTELLPEAEGPIAVDVAQRTVTWFEAGVPRARPLQAFSSGEQAFAYTRARLAVLDEQQPRPANRLIVLDEFGAFIAHDRLAGLLAYIRDRAARHPEDQVLVILPLNRNYGEMAETTIGPEKARLEDLAAEIRANKFAVQVLAQ